jgi:hypothetical protein
VAPKKPAKHSASNHAQQQKEKEDARILHKVRSRQSKMVNSLNFSSGVGSNPKAESLNLIKKYARCLVAPYDNPAYVPTAQNTRSSIIRSRKVYDISVPLTGANAGRFAMFIQPKLGSPDRPDHYQVGSLDMDKLVGEVSLMDPSVYTDVGLLSLDSNSPYVTQRAPCALGLSQTVFDHATNVNLLYNLQPWSPVVDKPFTFNMDYSQRIISTVTAISTLTVAAGSYLMAIFTTTTAASTAQRTYTPTIVAGVNNDEVAGSLTTLFESGVNSTGQIALYSVLITPNDSIRLAYTGSSTPTLARVVMVPLTTPLYQWSSDFGMVEQVRPVGQSVLFTSTLSAINDSGNVHTAITSDGSKDKVFSNNAQNWTKDGSSLSAMDPYQSGLVKTGAYSWWCPRSPGDFEFKSVEAHNDHQYPTILMVGNIGSIPAAGSSNIIGRVVIESVFEIQHNAQLLDKKMVGGSTAMVEAGQAIVKKLPQLTENPTHGDLLKSIGSGVKTVADMAELAAKFAGLFF